MIFDKLHQLNERIKEIEKKHDEYFKQRGDKIEDHLYAMNENNTLLGIGWKKDTDLRTDIREEVLQVAKQIMVSE